VDSGREAGATAVAGEGWVAVVEVCYGAMADNPQRIGKELRLDLAGLQSARRGDFRVVYRIDAEARRVEVVAIEHRADVYRSR
jgi:mRNA-degrading endonuclease RelE of RelBE toxin-antitoxin system